MNGPSPDTAAANYAANVAHNYGAPPITLVKGQGTLVWDAAGKRYLDFASGIAVNAVGHAHPHWVKRVTEQAGKLVHVSNLYRNEPQGELAHALSLRCGPGRVIFCNSGAEANEGLLKLARLHGQRKSGTEGACIGVIVAEKIAGVKGVHPLNTSNVAGCTYCWPQVASVGMTEAKAKAQNKKE